MFCEAKHKKFSVASEHLQNKIRSYELQWGGRRSLNPLAISEAERQGREKFFDAAYKQ